MTGMEFLDLTRGPLFQISMVIFAVGVTIRLVEILMLGRKPDLSEPRQEEMMPGLKAVVQRTLPAEGMFAQNPFTIVAGYLFHVGLFVVILFFIPHIEVIRAVLHIGWQGLPTTFVDAMAVVSILAMLGVLVNRIKDPVLSFLSRPEDYLVWTITFLPLLTGYMAFHHILFSYPILLALHILSVELLLVLFPFTKLMHTFTIFLSRWYTGASFGRKGVQP
ncbi:MAG: respiratory nitrate reductase subunit gamma [Gammaproteobacteria bacterium]|nr:respiratory nitrate reductase subunit gamma [Gammaproteobacteria bacterium]